MPETIDVTAEDLEQVLLMERGLRWLWLRTLGMLVVTVVLYLACAWACVQGAWEGHILSCLINAAAAGANQAAIPLTRSLLKKVGEERVKLAHLRQRIIEARDREA